MTISDETLMAYLDNELSPEERAQVGAAIASDPNVKARLERQARVHAMLSEAFGPVMKQPVPEHLVSTAMTAPASLRWRLGAAFSRIASPTAPGLVPRLALATATFLLGIGLSWMVLSPDRSSLMVGSDGSLVAQGDLADALDNKLASDDATTGPRVGVTFRSKDSEFCRTFETGTVTNAAGIACHDIAGWKIHTVTRTVARTGGSYEVAGASMPQAIRNAVVDMIDGAPFDAVQERKARDQGWR